MGTVNNTKSEVKNQHSKRHSSRNTLNYYEHSFGGAEGINQFGVRMLDSDSIDSKFRNSLTKLVALDEHENVVPTNRREFYLSIFT